MRKMVLLLAGGIVLSTLLPAPASAQGRRGDYGRGRGGDHERGVPAFCRTGQGHPVFGRSWCYEKGFGPGRSHWRRSDFDVSLHWPRRYRARVERVTLIAILGDRIYARFETHKRRLGLRAQLEGRWLVSDRGPAVLEIRAGSFPLGEISDFDRDGRADIVMLNHRR